MVDNIKDYLFNPLYKEHRIQILSETEPDNITVCRFIDNVHRAKTSKLVRKHHNEIASVIKHDHKVNKLKSNMAEAEEIIESQKKDIAIWKAAIARYPPDYPPDKNNNKKVASNNNPCTKKDNNNKEDNMEPEFNLFDELPDEAMLLAAESIGEIDSDNVDNNDNEDEEACLYDEEEYFGNLYEKYIEQGATSSKPPV